MKKKIYKLKDLSYAGLSMTYIGLIILSFVICIILAASSTMNNNWVMVIVWMLIGFGIILFLIRVGSKYGDYGLEILIAKLFQPKHIKNNFPLFEQHLTEEHDRPSTKN